MRKQAISDEISSMIAERTRNREWLEKRFGPEMEAFAQQQLEGKKERSIKTPFGTIGFRTTQGSTKVIDKERALLWVKENAPDALVIKEEVVVSPLKGRQDLPDCFEVIPASDNFYIKTGLKT